MILLRNKLSFVSLCSNFGTSVRSLDYIPTLDNDNVAIINTQSSNMQGEHWIIIANFRHQLYFADSLGYKGYSFLNNQHFKQMMPEPLQSRPSVSPFIQNMQNFISSSFNEKKLQEFKMLLYFHS